MEFALVFIINESKIECVLPVMKIKEKIKTKEGVELQSFMPKDENDFISSKWYFAKYGSDSGDSDATIKWSRITILYLGATEDDIERKRSNERLKYTSTKYMETESSFDEDSNLELLVRVELAYESLIITIDILLSLVLSQISSFFFFLIFMFYT
ncbi:uncharacterized protein LOC107980813 [Nasonia vitripennis]|uniref:Uncharacterized protein n=1 Tax=Nasonia vitripennis TaxID=7425 RepID=A0A7M7QMB1_NASVI|nr:uncharacterized protein LOC107980813 [Nasonia vitripennis]